jgi:hypothetical protein
VTEPLASPTAKSINTAFVICLLLIVGQPQTTCEGVAALLRQVLAIW